MIKAIFIDMDDTLLATTALYETAKDAFKAYLAPYGITRDEVEKVYDQAERDLFAVHGYSRARFPASFAQTLKHFVPDATPEMVAEVRGFGEKVFTTPAALLHGAEEGMDILLDNYPVYLVTQGDKSVQEDRIAQLPFKDRLKDIFIIEKKSKETFETLAAQLGYQPSEVVMVGDSLKSDVNPAVAAGLRVMWIEGANWKMMENSDHTCPVGVEIFKTVLEAAQRLTEAPKPVPPSPKPGPRL